MRIVILSFVLLLSACSTAPRTTLPPSAFPHYPTAHTVTNRDLLSSSTHHRYGENDSVALEVATDLLAIFVDLYIDRHIVFHDRDFND